MAESDREAAVETAGADKQRTVSRNRKAERSKGPERSQENRVRSVRREVAGKAERSSRAREQRQYGSSGYRQKKQKARARRQSVADSFGHAFEGVLTGVLEERNMKIHCVMAALVVFFGLVLHISVTEWCICFILFGLIMGLELVNTAIEAAVDLATQEYHPLAKRAKDTAAGAVLIASIMAAVTGLLIFIPRLLYFFHNLF